MKFNFQTKMILGVACFGLLFGLLRFEEMYTQDKAAKKEEELTLIKVDENQLKKIEIFDEATSRFQIYQAQKGDQTTWMVQDSQKDLRAHQKAIDEFINNLNSASVLTFFDYESTQEGETDPYGFQQPLLSLKLENQKEETLEKEKILITKAIPSGQDTEVPKGYYAWVESKPNKLFIVDSSFVTDLKEISLKSLRNRKAFELNVLDLHKFKVDSDRALGEHFLVQKEQGSWQIQKPSKLPTDQDSINLFLNRLEKLEVSEVLEKEDLPFSLKNKEPDYQISLSDESGDKKQILKVFSTDDERERILTMPGQVYGKLGESAWSDLKLTLNRVTNKSFFLKGDFDQIASLQIENFQFQKEEESWKLKVTEEHKFTEEQLKQQSQNLNQLLSEFEFAQADEIIQGPTESDLKKLSFEPLSFEVIFQKEDNPVHFQVGQKINNQFPIKVSNRPDLIFLGKDFWTDAWKRIKEGKTSSSEEQLSKLESSSQLNDFIAPPLQDQ